MPRSLPSLLLVLALGAAPAAAQPEVSPLTAKQVVVLLKAGISSDAVQVLVERRGAARGLQDADLDLVRAAGGTKPLVDALAKALQPRRELGRIATNFTVHRDATLGLAMLIPKRPKPWKLSTRHGADGSTLVVRPGRAPGTGLLREPAIVAWVVPETRFPGSIEDAVADRVAHLVRVRLGRSGLIAAKAEASRGLLCGVGAVEHRFRLTERRTRFRGELRLRTRLARDGSLIAVGLIAPIETVEAAAGRFDRVAADLELDRSLSP